jgi:hypothetical protein
MYPFVANSCRYFSIHLRLLNVKYFQECVKNIILYKGVPINKLCTIWKRNEQSIGSRQWTQKFHTRSNYTVWFIHWNFSFSCTNNKEQLLSIPLIDKAKTIIVYKRRLATSAGYVNNGPNDYKNTSTNVKNNSIKTCSQCHGELLYCGNVYKLLVSKRLFLSSAS